MRKASMKTSTPKSLIKKLQTIVAVLGLATCGTGISYAANVLQNGYMDNLSPPNYSLDIPPQINPGPAGWVIEADKTVSGSFTDGADSETFNNFAQPGGYGVFFKPFQGATNSLGNDLLNVNLYQDNPIFPGSVCTLTGYASCGGSYCGFLVGAPTTQFLAIDFLDGSGNVIQSTLTPLIPGLLGTGAGAFTQFTVTATAPLTAATVRCRACMTNAYNVYNGDQSLNFDDFDLEVTPPAGSPTITSQPGAASVATGGNTSFTVVATSATTYLWQANGVNVTNGVNGISGQGTATLTITGASTNNIASYRVLVSNGSGGLYSSVAPLALNGVLFLPTVTLSGVVGATYALERSSTVNGTYTPFSTNTLTAIQPLLVPDTTQPVSPNEFYKTVFLY